MKAFYCNATNSFFKVVEDGRSLSRGALKHLGKREWKLINTPKDFDGDVNHYKLENNQMVSRPENEWPENIVPEGV